MDLKNTSFKNWASNPPASRESAVSNESRKLNNVNSNVTAANTKPSPNKVHHFMIKSKAGLFSLFMKMWVSSLEKTNTDTNNGIKTNKKTIKNNDPRKL